MHSAEIITPVFLSNSILKIWNYLEVGRWLHFIALAAAVLSVYFFNLAMEAHWMNNTNGNIIFGYLSFHFSTIPFFAELDAYSRFQNYKLVKDLIYRYGFQDRFIRALRHSKCQREAAFFAARDLGCKKMLVSFYQKCGYRWYHILPDFVWTHPHYLVSKHFWFTTFFVKTYNPKYYRNQI